MDLKSRKALLSQYREQPRPRGVFGIRSAAGTVFLDASSDMPALWNRHRFQLNFGNHPNRVLQDQWRRDGEAAFVFEVVAELKYDTDGPHDVRADLEALLALCWEDRKPEGAQKL